MCDVESRIIVPKRFRQCKKNVWNDILALIDEHDALNLGIGCPDYPPPEYITDTLAQVATNENSLLHQYTRCSGHLKLTNAFSKLYGKLLKRNIDAQKEVFVMAGSFLAIYTAIIAIIDEDDEVIIIEPYFDFYENVTKIAKGKCKFVPLRLNEGEGGATTSSQWKLDERELENAFNEKTKLFILNTPNNPLGKVFTFDELDMIADLCKKWNVVCLSDEVYEFFVYKPDIHVRMCSLPGMWERTVTICCPGKTFGVTGWDLGIAYGSTELISNLLMIHQHIVHVGNTPTQEAYGVLFEREMENFDTIVSSHEQLVKKRDFVVEILNEAGMKPIIPQGGLVISADWTPLASRIVFDSDSEENRDFQLVRWMIEHVGLAPIPTSLFYSAKNRAIGEKYIRFCFWKSDETLRKFAEILKKWSSNG